MWVGGTACDPGGVGEAGGVALRSDNICSLCTIIKLNRKLIHVLNIDQISYKE